MNQVGKTKWVEVFEADSEAAEIADMSNMSSRNPCFTLFPNEKLELWRSLKMVGIRVKRTWQSVQTSRQALMSRRITLKYLYTCIHQ